MATTPPAAPSNPAAPFTRYHHPDLQIDRLFQDIYDKLAQVQAQVTKLSQVTKP